MHWARIQPLVPVNPPRADGKGRPPTPPRPNLNAILWILRTGPQWPDLPDQYSSFPTVRCGFQKSARDRVIEEILRVLAGDLVERGTIDVT